MMEADDISVRKLAKEIRLSLTVIQKIRSGEQNDVKVIWLVLLKRLVIPSFFKKATGASSSGRAYRLLVGVVGDTLPSLMILCSKGAGFNFSANSCTTRICFF